jgi:glycosyltransferase involved in cell wall biosynthesis
VAAQTRLPDEVVVVDGGAGDDSRRKSLEWQNRLPIRYLHTSPAGLTRQRNAALGETTADVVLFMDDDSSLALTHAPS